MSQTTNKLRETSSNRRGQKGLTLVELVIAMALGLSIMAVVIQLFVGMTTNYSAMYEGSTIQNNGTFALDFIGRSVRKAGFKEIHNDELDTPTAFPKDATFSEGQVIAGEDAALFDRFSIRFAPTEKLATPSADYFPTRDCVGNVVEWTKSGGHSYTPVELQFYVNSNSELVCIDANKQEQVLINNVASFQVKYGLDTNKDGYYVDEYKSADDITDDSEWRSVLSVKVALLLQSTTDLLAKETTKEYVMLDDIKKEFKDKKNRQIYEHTIAMRSARHLVN